MRQKKNSGQALVEFVMIVPIILFLLFIIIDFSNVFYHKNRLERTLDDVVSYVKNDEENISSMLDDNVTYTLKEHGRYLTIEVTEKVVLITPFSNIFFDNPYSIETERTILYEK